MIKRTINRTINRPPPPEVITIGDKSPLQIEMDDWEAIQDARNRSFEVWKEKDDKALQTQSPALMEEAWDEFEDKQSKLNAKWILLSKKHQEARGTTEFDNIRTDRRKQQKQKEEEV